MVTKKKDNNYVEEIILGIVKVKCPKINYEWCRHKNSNKCIYCSNNKVIEIKNNEECIDIYCC